MMRGVGQARVGRTGREGGDQRPWSERWLGPLAGLLVLSLLGGFCPLGYSQAQSPPPDPRFGAVEAFWDSASAAEAGVGWERVLFYWSELQPNGPDEWNADHVGDVLLSQAVSAGREVVGLLKHTPAWATDGPPGCGVPGGLNLPVDDPGNLWAAFVRRVVGTYAGRVNRWIVWNEPDIAPDSFGAEWCGSVEDYYRLLQVAYLAAHQANPDVVIHLGALTFWHDRTYLRRLLEVATRDPSAAEHDYYFDVVSLHIYFQTESVPYIINETRAALNGFGIRKPIWVNETNAASNFDPPYWELPEANFNITLEEQAGFLLQAFALALASGAERVAVYRWVDHEPQPGVEPNGLIRMDHTHRPAYGAYRLITTYYAGTRSAHAYGEPLFYQVTLGREGQTTRVLWARTASTVTVAVPALAGEGLLVAQDGTAQLLQPAGGVYTLVLPGARCADSRGCIIGGPTYLLVETGGGGAGPSSVVGPDGVPQTGPTATVPPPEATSTPVSEPEPTPTQVTVPTPTQVAVPTPTPAPTDTPVPTPRPGLGQVSSLSASPTPAPEPGAGPWWGELAPAPLLALLLGVLLLGCAVVWRVWSRRG